MMHGQKNIKLRR